MANEIPVSLADLQRNLNGFIAVATAMNGAYALSLATMAGIGMSVRDDGDPALMLAGLDDYAKQMDLIEKLAKAAKEGATKLIEEMKAVDKEMAGG